MNQKPSLTTQILAWCEIVIAVRIFLFTVPILVKNTFFSAPHIFEVHDWFIVVLTLTGLIYLLAGLTFLMGYKLRHFFHVCAFILVGFMTYALFHRAKISGSVFEYFYMTPAIFSALVTVLAVVIKSKLRTS